MMSIHCDNRNFNINVSYMTLFLLINDIHVFDIILKHLSYKVRIPIFFCQTFNNDIDDSIIRLLIPIFNCNMLICHLPTSRVQNQFHLFIYEYYLFYIHNQDFNVQYRFVQLFSYPNIDLTHGMNSFNCLWRWKVEFF